MSRPHLWLLPSGGYSFRINIHFVSSAGDHFQSQTWDFHHSPEEPAQVLLLQANARLVGDDPALEKIDRNYISITIKVAALEGPLTRTVLPGGQQEALTQQMAAFPLTLAILKRAKGLKFALLTANPKA
jgi:hypothetical protein